MSRMSPCLLCTRVARSDRALHTTIHTANIIYYSSSYFRTRRTLKKHKKYGIKLNKIEFLEINMKYKLVDKNTRDTNSIFHTFLYFIFIWLHKKRTIDFPRILHAVVSSLYGIINVILLVHTLSALQSLKIALIISHIYK